MALVASRKAQDDEWWRQRDKRRDQRLVQPGVVDQSDGKGGVELAAERPGRLEIAPIQAESCRLRRRQAVVAHVFSNERHAR